MNLVRTVASLPLLVCCLWGWADAITPSQIVNRMEKKIRSVNDLRVEFTITTVTRALGREQVSMGKILLKRKKSFRLELADKVIASDGSAVWTYFPQNAQIIVSAVDSYAESLQPDRILPDYVSDHVMSLVREERLDGAKCYVLRLTPREPDSYLRDLWVWIDGKTWFPKRAVYEDTDGNTTKYVFSSVALDPGLDDSLFRLRATAGVEVVDIR